uniref:BICD family like cargo adaptor 1 n=1 Tax=Acanthochromis polyacanthus TaxID=80966 RepID=A0A3Q1EP03_9TELE
MSAFCLDLQTSAVVSAPLELDSDCMEPRASPTTQEPGGFQGHPLRHAGSGGLGMALEEELAMLTGERGDEEELTELETPAVGHNADLLSLFRQKEKDLVLAAKLGKALLERNQDLTKQYEKMHKDLNEKLEHLEQEKHELRRRMESREGEWESRVSELETDVQELQGELDRHQVQLREADRDKTKAISELSEQNHRLLEQLSRAAEVERQLSTQVHSLRDDFREKSMSTGQHMTRLETLQAEIKMLSERKMELERRVHAMLEENELLQNTVDDLRERTLVLEKQCHEKDLQVQTHEWANFEGSYYLKQSMEQEEQEQEREQVIMLIFLRLQLWEAYCEVRSLCSHLRGNDVTDSALSTDSSMDESSETSSAKDVPTGSLHTSLLELRRLTQNLLDGNESTMALLSVELCSLREENERMRLMAEVREPSEQLQSAIRDRDDAIAKKKAVEMELAKCKIDIMSLNSQLLDAIQQKLNLSQQLEAWQDDMHRVIDQQLMDKHQDEWRLGPTPLSGSSRVHGGLSSRRAHRISDRDKRLFSFFKKN